MASGEAGRFERTYFNVRVFNPHAPSNRQSSLSSCYRRQESLKKCAYEQRVREVEHASLVLSATGGMANEATVFYKILASCLAMKWDHSYSSTMSWLHCHLTFPLLHSAIQCIRGARSSNSHAAESPPPIDLVISELRCIWTIWLLDSWLFHCSLYSYIFKDLKNIISVKGCRDGMPKSM